MPWLALACAFAVGAFVRLWRLPEQILGGDELHAVRAALNDHESFTSLLYTYHVNDNCLPMSAWFRFWLQAGGTLDETVLRAPTLLCGLLLLLVVPLAMKRVLGRTATAALAFALALSPLLVLYSRIARSYMPMILLASVAVGAAYAWWRSGRTLPAVIYVVCGALAVWFHPVAVPYIGAPMVVVVGDLLLRSGRPNGGPDLRGVVITGAGLGLCLATFLGPGWSSLRAMTSNKSGAGHLTVDGVLGVLQLQAGQQIPAITVLTWALIAWGALVAIRRAPSAAAFGGVLLLGQVAAVIVLAPAMLQKPWVLNRYLIIALPVLLAALALGLASLVERLGARAVMAASALTVALAMFGPMGRAATWSTSFLGHNDFVQFYEPRAELEPNDMPAFYNSDLEPGPIIELPWHPAWKYSRTHYIYQQVHGHPVRVAPEDPQLADPRLTFRNMLSDPAEYLASDARYLVLHHDMLGMEDQLSGDGRGLPLEKPARIATERRKLAVFTAAMWDTLRADWGPPDTDDGVVAVWDLARVRTKRRL